MSKSRHTEAEMIGAEAIGGGAESRGRGFVHYPLHRVRGAGGEIRVTAVTVVVPTLSVEVVKLAEPPLNVPVPSTVFPFMKETVSPSRRTGAGRNHRAGSTPATRTIVFALSDLWRGRTRGSYPLDAGADPARAPSEQLVPSVTLTHLSGRPDLNGLVFNHLLHRLRGPRQVVLVA